MRRVALIISISFVGLVGCQCPHKPVAATQPVALADRDYVEARACALVFSPPIAQNDAPLDLSRADREPGAFVGFEDLSQTYLYVRTDDRWTGDGNDNYERRAISEKVSSVTR